MKTYTVLEDSSILDVLKKIFPDSSNTTLREILQRKRVYVNLQLCVNAKKIVEKDCIVEIHPTLKKIPYGIEIIFEDSDILVINKPSDLLSVPLDNGKMENALIVLRKFFDNKNILPVHRIDKGTSGVMIFSKNTNSYDKLKEMFKLHELKREYLAIVDGNLEEQEGIWQSYLTENSEYSVRSVPDETEGKIAITYFSVIKKSKNFTYIKLRLETGRKHQIRVHCKDAGHPILGDKRYAPEIVSPISRMCLHSFLLEFLHPITRKKMSFTAPIPSAFKKLGLINKNFVNIR